MLNESKTLEMIRAKNLKKQKGASMIEYALVVAGVAAIAAVVFSGEDGSAVETAIEERVTAAIEAPAAAE